MIQNQLALIVPVILGMLLVAGVVEIASVASAAAVVVVSVAEAVDAVRPDLQTDQW